MDIVYSPRDLKCFIIFLKLFCIRLHFTDIIECLFTYEFIFIKITTKYKKALADNPSFKLLLQVCGWDICIVCHRWKASHRFFRSHFEQKKYMYIDEGWYSHNLLQRYHVDYLVVLISCNTLAVRILTQPGTTIPRNLIWFVLVVQGEKKILLTVFMDFT